MIEVLPDFPANVLAFACHGHITRHDYDSVLIPAVNRALKEHDTIRLYYETAADFDGVDPGAVLADARVGLRHLTRWERFAVVTDVEWIRHTMQLFSFMLPGEMKVFTRAEAAQARRWIAD